MKEKETTTMMMRKNVRQEKIFFFFGFGQGPHFLRMRYVAQRESSRHRSEFFL